MIRHIFLLFAFCNLQSINAQDFDNINKSKLIKVETVTENDILFKIESYEAGTIKYRVDAFGKGYADNGTLYQSSNTIVKSILSDSVTYRQNIDIKLKGKKTVHKTISKRSLMYKKIGDNDFEQYGIEHGEFSRSYYENETLIESEIGFFCEGKLNGKMTRVFMGQLINEENYKMGIPNGIEIKKIQKQGKYFLEQKGEWLDGEKKGKWVMHEYITIKEFSNKRNYLFNNFKIHLSDTSIIGKWIEENFYTEILAIQRSKIEAEEFRRKIQEEGGEIGWSADVDTSSLIDIVETREYFPDGNIDEKVYFENEYYDSEGYISPREGNRLVFGSKMVRLIKDNEYYPQEYIEKWMLNENRQEICREKFNFQKENPLIDDGHKIAWKKSKLIKIEIFVNGILYYCVGNCD